MKSNTLSTTISTRRIFFVMLFCALGLSSCQQATDNNPSGSFISSLPVLSVPWTDQNSIVCFGTSLTYGYGAGEKKPRGFISRDTTGNYAFVGDSSYPRFLKEALRISVINKGYVGARASYALSILKDSVLSKKPVLVLLEFGANEFLQRVSSHETDSVLSLLVLNILQSGSQIVILSFINPDMTKFMANGYWTTQDSARAIEYYTMLSNLSKRLSVPFMDYPLQGVFGYSSLMSDQLHPNGAGYMKMEQNIFQALMSTFQQNGMLK